MRNLDMARTFITTEPAELARILDDRSVEVTAIDELDKKRGAILITYVKKPEWVEEHGSSNIGESFFSQFPNNYFMAISIPQY